MRLAVDTGASYTTLPVEVVEMQALLRSRSELHRYLAVELYRQGKVSLSRAAEISGVDIESFKEVLREAGISRTIPPVGKALRDEVDLLTRVRQIDLVVK